MLRRFLLFLIFTAPCVPLVVAAEGGGDAVSQDEAVAETLDAMTHSPGWKDSLREIQRKTLDLLEKNTVLEDEASGLREEIAALEQTLQTEQDAAQGIREEISRRRQEADVRAQVQRLRQEQQLVEKALALQKKELESADARLAASRQSLGLWQMKLREQELEEAARSLQTASLAKTQGLALEQE
ncbi:MAG: hypothetical protein GX606_03500, partial [Elusimicrobia bacterium]|nr:hypothetical protein [Elusimicrobiota bacterium]